MCLGISDSQDKIKKILLVINTLNIYLNDPIHYNIIKDIIVKVKLILIKYFFKFQ